jgi:hypothetical protein
MHSKVGKHQNIENRPVGLIPVAGPVLKLFLLNSGSAGERDADRLKGLQLADGTIYGAGKRAVSEHGGISVSLLHLLRQ